MTFHDIIEQNMKKCSVKWWPNYAYHFTDVNNAVNIIKQGFLYSRTIAKEKRLMINDNASRKVIEMTSGEISDFVRFYFRPLTPTQYNNEGFKHSAIRYDKDPFANVPVPIFFFFWLEPLLKNPNTLFTGSSAAGGVTEKKRGLEQFCSLEFENIYANGPYTSEIPEVKKRETELRQAEILYPSKYPLPIISSLAMVYSSIKFFCNKHLPICIRLTDIGCPLFSITSLCNRKTTHFLKGHSYPSISN